MQTQLIAELHKPTEAPPARLGLAEADDATLVVAAQRGGGEAFEILVHRHRARILRAASRFTRNEADAEDIVQQSFEKAFLHLQQFEGHSSFSTWLTRIAMNEALMWVPKRGSRVEMPLEQSSADDGATQPLDFPDSTPNPEDRCAPLAIQRKTARGANQMELKIAGFCGETTGRQTHRSDDRLEGHRTSAATKSPSLLGWYHILRAHHQWTVFQAIRYALWLTR